MAIIFNKSFISSFKPVFFPHFYSFFPFFYLSGPIFQFFHASHALDQARKLRGANMPVAGFHRFEIPKCAAAEYGGVRCQNEYATTLQLRIRTPALPENPDLDQKKAPRRVLFSWCGPSGNAIFSFSVTPELRW